MKEHHWVFVTITALFVLLAFSVGRADAGSSCYQMGGTVYCNGNNGAWNSSTYQMGGQTYTNGTYRDPNSGQTRSFTQSCYWMGGTRYCN